MQRLKYLALITALAATGPASAGLLGQQVDGSLTFAGSPNAFDPANGAVPMGYLNEAGTTVTIQEPAIEFGYEDDSNLDTANFTDTTLTIRDLVKISSSVSGHPNDPFEMTFTSVIPGLFASISLISDNFSPLLTSPPSPPSLIGNTITINWNGGNVTAGQDFVAVFKIETNAVPEPATLALMGVGLVGIGLGKRRRVPAASA